MLKVEKKASKKPSHVKAETPLIPAGQKGWWRLKHVLAFYGISASEYYTHAGNKYRAPDIHRGRIPFWRSENF